MVNATVVISAILALSAIVGTCALTIAGVQKLSAQISDLSARVGKLGDVGNNLNASLDNLEAEVRTLKQLLQQKGML